MPGFFNSETEFLLIFSFFQRNDEKLFQRIKKLNLKSTKIKMKE